MAALEAARNDQGAQNPLLGSQTGSGGQTSLVLLPLR